MFIENIKVNIYTDNVSQLRILKLFVLNITNKEWSVKSLILKIIKIDTWIIIIFIWVKNLTIINYIGFVSIWCYKHN